MNDKKVIAVYSFGLCGIQILDIEYGINDKVIYLDTMGKTHKAVVKENTKGDSYFRYCGGFRIYLKECLRV